MKKKIFVVLWAGICCCMLSCNPSENDVENTAENNKYESYEILLQYLEEDNIEEAYKEMVRILQPMDMIQGRMKRNML